MPTKPTDNVPEWASNANYTVGPTGIIGTPTKESTSLATAVANGFTPWLPEAPATGEHTNEWMHRGWALLDWVYQGSATASADAHIVETDSAGRAALTAAASASPGLGTITSTVTGSGGIAVSAGSGDNVAVSATNNSASLPAIVAANSDGSPGAASISAAAAGDGDGFRADVFNNGRGFVVDFDPGVGFNARGIVCDLGATDVTGIAVNAGTGSGVGILVEGGIVGTTGISCYAASGTGTLVRCQHNGSGTAISVQTFSTAAAISVDASGGASSSGAVQINGDGTSGPAIFAYNLAQAGTVPNAIARASIRAEVGEGAGGHGVAIVGNAQDPFSAAGIGVYAISAGLTSASAGIIADASFGTGHGAVLVSSDQRSSLRLQPTSGSYPANGALGDVSSVDLADPLNDGLAFHDGTAWRRVAHTPRRTRDPAVGFTNANPGGPIAEGSTVSLLAPATFTAADGGDVILEATVGLSITGGAGFARVSLLSDDGAGGSITTHLSLHPIRLLSFSADGRSGADTESSRFSWIRKIAPTGTGARRYYMEVECLTIASGVVTVYYWYPQIKVSGEVAP